MNNYSSPFIQSAASDHKTHQLIDSIRSGVLLLGTQSEVYFCNKAALEILGMPAERLYDKKPFNAGCDIIREDGTVFEAMEQPVHVCIITRKPVSNIVMGVYRPVFQDRVWLMVHAEPVLTDAGDVEQVVCSFSDITERKNQEEQLRWLYQSLEIRAMELATTNTDLKQFINVATHDLQEPLRMVSSFTQLLQKKYAHQLDEQARAYIEHAVSGATRMKKLIQGLLEYATFTNNRDESGWTNSATCLARAINSLEKEITEAGAVITIEPLPDVIANATLLTQLFGNLISNALQFRSTEIPNIQIAYTDTPAYHQFSISDNGIGIEEKYFEKIFVLFQRLHINGEQYNGIGAGLAICKKIVELHEGTIWVTSTPGQGSTFYFTISKKPEAYAL